MFFHRPPQSDASVQPAPSLPPVSEVSEELHLLALSTVRFRQEGSRLQMQQEGEEDWKEVSLVRLFPLSEPEKWISVLDKEGKELGVLLELQGLAVEDLDCAREELRRRYLVPEVLRILACRDKFDLVEWTVETDRGQVTFLTRNLREQVQQPLSRRLILTDVEGSRYDVPDTDALDPQSRRWLEERL